MATDTKTLLLASAERAVRSRGFDAFSYADLAHDIGIRKASIHYHFPTKAILSVALIKRYCETFTQTCTDIDANYQTGGAQLSALIQSYRAALNDGHSLCLCVSLSTSRQNLSPDAIQQISQFRDMMTDWIAAKFAAGQKDGSIRNVQDWSAEAVSTLALLEGAQLSARCQESPLAFDLAVRLLQQRL